MSYARAERRRAERRGERPPGTAPQSIVDVRGLWDIPTGALAGGKRVCLSCIMREDNPEVVARGLRSVRPFCTSWAVVDTGSTDAVRQTIRRELADIPGQLVEREWPDNFATARNWALDLARTTGSEWGMFHDGDDYIQETQPVFYPLPQFISNFASFDSLTPALVRMRRNTFARLLPSIKWIGAVHEQLTDTAVPHGSLIDMDLQQDYVVRVTYTGRQSRQSYIEKTRYYLRLQDKELAKNRDDLNNWRGRVAMLHEVGDFAGAVEAADSILQLPQVQTHTNAADIRYSTLLLRGCCQEQIGHSTDEIVDGLMRAYEQSPERAEAPRVLAGILRARGERLGMARRLDAEADQKTIPLYSDHWIHLPSYKGMAVRP